MNCRRFILSCMKTGVYRTIKVQPYSSTRLCFHTKIECCFSRNELPNNKGKAQNGLLRIPRVSWNLFIREYAKGKDKKKSDKGKKNVPVDESVLGELVDLENLKNHFQKTVDVMKDEYVKNLSLRSATGSFEKLKIKFDGAEHTLQDLAQIIRKNPKTIVVNMSSFPTAIPAALEAIQKSGMNLNPQQDGTTLYIPVPKLTKEHREGLAKNAKALFIKCRDSLRDVQNKYIKNLKNKEHVSTDDIFSAQQQITSLCNVYIAEAEKMMETKQKELLG